MTAPLPPDEAALVEKAREFAAKTWEMDTFQHAVRRTAYMAGFQDALRALPAIREKARREGMEEAAASIQSRCSELEARLPKASREEQLRFDVAIHHLRHAELVIRARSAEKEPG